jgi:hypothetical protein
MVDLFAQGSRWRHRRLLFVVRLKCTKNPDAMRIVWENPELESSVSNHMIKGEWTTLALLQDFVPIVQLSVSAWDRLLENAIICEDSAVPEEKG